MGEGSSNRPEKIQKPCPNGHKKKTMLGKNGKNSLPYFRFKKSEFDIDRKGFFEGSLEIPSKKD